MKKLILLKILALYSGVVFSTTVTIVNSEFTFSPNDITINAGDTVIFQLAGIHNAIEVSFATWTADDNTPLPGFSLPLGGGQVTGLTAGIHYYVCGPHASMGMKGKITVTASSGIDDIPGKPVTFNCIPNPTTGKITVNFKSSGNLPAYSTGSGQQQVIELYNSRVRKSQTFKTLQQMLPAKLIFHLSPREYILSG